MSDDVETENLPAEIPPPRKVGRPKGSKNKITTLKLIAEEAARDRNADRIQYVIDLIIADAAKGSVSAQKLVWQAVMSQGIPNEQKAAEKVEINIGTTYHDERVKVKDVEPVIKPVEVIDGEIIEEESDNGQQAVQ